MKGHMATLMTGRRLLRMDALRLQGQSTMEYAVFVAVVAAALMGMQVYVRRAIQANLKTLEEQVNAEAVPTPAGQPQDTRG